MDLEGLSTHSVRGLARGEGIVRILTAALKAVEPGEAVSKHLQRQSSVLQVDDRAFDLNRFRRVRLVGAGKAGFPMALAAVEILGSYFSEGLVIVKEGYLDKGQSPISLEFREAGHPIPDKRGIEATQGIQSMLADSQPDDLLLVLISGGGSALMTAPAPGISLADLQKLTGSLLASGANIQQINMLRKHLDIVKGGGLARMASPATVITLILSDVVGDPLDVIASGPTVPDPTTFSEALHVLERYQLLESTPAAILDRLRRGARGEEEETPKPDDPLFKEVNNVIIGSNALAAQAAQAAAQSEGFNSILLTTFLQGEARQAGRFLASLVRQITVSGQPLPRPACLIAGGETTVTLRINKAQNSLSSLGGRNQELALAAVSEISGLADVALIALATDGGDGPTDAAGAVVTGDTLTRAQRSGLNPGDFLSRNDSYHFFAALDDLLKPGPTQTNVNDLTFLFAL